MLRVLPRKFWLVLPAAYLLYFFRLNGIGLIGPDEPRYAAIGRAMAQSGDWITPRLWGRPWFEKPALTYWMTAAGFRAGLGPELAPRLPVAIVSAAFLIFFYLMVRREFGGFAAAASTLILGTTAVWIGFSQVGVTDLPMAAAFSTAMLLALPWMGKRDTRYLPAAAGALGLAVLAKGLLPLVLAAPLGLRFRWFRDLARVRVVAPFLAVALPWYALCYGRNGNTFLYEFFVVHHLERFTEGGLKHVQPWWFYLPLLPALLLPWAALLPAAVWGHPWREPRRLFLLLWAGFGLLFFSASTNKLPGYLLPLAPPVAILMALGLETRTREERRSSATVRLLLAGCALLLAAYVLVAPLLPAAIANQWAGAPRPVLNWMWLLALLPAAAVWMLDLRGMRLGALALVAAGAVGGVGYLKISAEPAIDRTATARVLGGQVARNPQQVCLDGVRRAFEYGLEYYAGTELPQCSEAARPFHVVETKGLPPRLSGR